MTNAIVSVNVTQTVAPTPPSLQQTGALVSQGATDLAPGTSYFLTQLSDLTPILKGAQSLSGLIWAGGTVTATASGSLNFTVGDTLELTVSGVTPAAYNGTFLCNVTGARTFTYVLASNPGVASIFGAYTPEDVAELLAMATTFFAQGAQTGVYALELGPGNVNDGVASLGNYLTQYPNSGYVDGAAGYFYIYLVPRTWDGNAAFLALIAQYEALDAATYFFVTTTLATYQSYTALMKCIFALVETPQTSPYASNPLTAISWSNGVVTATTQNPHGVSPGDWFQLQGVVPIGYNGYSLALPGTVNNTLVYPLATNPGGYTTLGTLIASLINTDAIPTTEFTLAAAMRVALNYQPSQTNKVTPFAFAFLFGVTPFPTQGNSSLIASLKAAGINYAALGSEGGISNTCLFWGTTMDTRDFTYWYSVDWMTINANINLSNAVINGSNNPINPLYYDPDGINRLLSVLVATANSAVGVGLANGQVTRTSLSGPDLAAALDAGTYAGMILVNAVPFVPYLTINPGDYKIGRYAGLSVIYIPTRGFIQIVVNLNVTDFVVG